MNLAVLSLIVLAVVVAIGFIKKVNLGFLALGAAFILGSIGGMSSLKYFMGAQKSQNEANEVKNMEEKKVCPFDLIIAIANQGSIQQVMEAARAAGAGGGTVVHSRGIQSEQATAFWGLSVQEEKEIVLILAEQEKKTAIMSAVSEKCGMHRTYISAIECFRRSISLENIQRIADALGVEAYRLLLENQEGTENDK